MTKDELQNEVARLTAAVATLQSELDAANQQLAKNKPVLSDEIHKGLAVARRVIKDGKRLGGFAFSRNDMALVDTTFAELDAMKSAAVEPAPIEDESPAGEDDGEETVIPVTEEVEETDEAE